MKITVTLALALTCMLSMLTGCAEEPEPKFPSSAAAPPEDRPCDPNAPLYQLCLKGEAEKKAKLAAQAPTPPPPAAPAAPPPPAAPQEPPAKVTAQVQTRKSEVVETPATKVVQAPPPPQAAAAPPPPAGPPVQILPGMPAASAVAPCSLAEHNMLSVRNATDFALGVYGLVQRVSGTVSLRLVENNDRSRANVWVIAPRGEAQFCFVDPTSLPPSLQSTLPQKGHVEYVAYEDRGAAFPAKAMMRMGFQYPVPRERGNAQTISMGVMRHFRR